MLLLTSSPVEGNRWRKMPAIEPITSNRPSVGAVKGDYRKNEMQKVKNLVANISDGESLNGGNNGKYSKM